MSIYINPYSKEPLILAKEGLINDKEEIVYPIKNKIVFIEDSKNYTDNFGFEWIKFPITQLDSFSGSDISKKRFFKATRWGENLDNRNILEVGCGAGRFSEIVLRYTNANLFSIDYSNSVIVNRNNNGDNPRIRIFKASLYSMPFKDDTFDYIFCFGVLQHTPDFKKAISCIIEKLKPGGEIVIDFYPIKGWYTKINAKYLLRPIFKRLNNKLLFQIIKLITPFNIQLYKLNKKIKLDFLNRFIPISEMPNSLSDQLTKEQIKQWHLLDTFDMFSPKFDNPQKIKKVISWFNEFGLQNVEGDIIEYEKDCSVAVVKGIKKE